MDKNTKVPVDTRVPGLKCVSSAGRTLLGIIGVDNTPDAEREFGQSYLVLKDCLEMITQMAHDAKGMPFMSIGVTPIVPHDKPCTITVRVDMMIDIDDVLDLHTEYRLRCSPPASSLDLGNLPPMDPAEKAKLDRQLREGTLPGTHR